MLRIRAGPCQPSARENMDCWNRALAARRHYPWCGHCPPASLSQPRHLSSESSRPEHSCPVPARPCPELDLLPWSFPSSANYRNTRTGVYEVISAGHNFLDMKSPRFLTLGMTERWLRMTETQDGCHCEGAKRPWQSRLFLVFERGFGVEIFVRGDGLAALDSWLQAVADFYRLRTLVLLKLLDKAVALAEFSLIALQIERHLMVLIGGLDLFGQILMGRVGFVPAWTAGCDGSIYGGNLSYFQSAAEGTEEAARDRIAGNAERILLEERSEVF